MITKTYLDGRLNQLEENLKKRIEMKDERVSRETETDIADLKNKIKLLEERVEENRDLIRSCIEKKEIEKVKLDENKETNTITSDF